jgi:hypothetical protein
MLEITRKAIALEPQEVIELERIIIDEDYESAYRFLKRNIYRKLISSQENRLKSHLDGCHDPASTFAATKK